MSSPDSSGGVGAVVNAATGTMNAVSNAATDTMNAVSNAATNMFNSVTTSANNVAQNVPFLNSIVPATNSANKPANKPANNSGFNLFGNSSNANKPANAANANKPANAANANKPANAANANKPANAANANKPANSSAFNLFGAATNATKNAGTNAAAAAANSGSYGSYGLYIFIALVLTIVILFSVFTEQIQLGYQYVESNIRRFLNMSVPPDVTAAIAPPPDTPVTVPAEAPQDVTPKEASVPQPSQRSIVEKVLPSSGNEVFNVAQNKFTYYDAEPLCNALGAELATYEQVKDAWANGADWCNYGWVKGQMAVYPTQKQTYDKLQMGPADQRNVCGTVGLNGGYFDNPEFKYGVNCYGNKPSQTAHDEAMLMAIGKAPKTPATLKVDEMTAEYKDQADSLFVKPFNDSKWMSS